MTKKWVTIVALALVLMFATTGAAYAYTYYWAYGNLTSVSTNYAYHRDFYGTNRTFFYNHPNLSVKYKSGSTWYTASNPVSFVRTYWQSYNNDSVNYHQEYTTKVADQINFHNS